MACYTLAEIADKLGLTLQGDANVSVTGIAPIPVASAQQISFLADKKFQGQLAACQAAAVIVKPEHSALFAGNCLISDNPYLSFAKLTELFNNRPNVAQGVHPRAVVDTTAKLGKNVAIGPNAVISANAQIGDNCQIAANCFVGEGVTMGANCNIAANVSIYHEVELGQSVLVHSGTVIGCDGFGFAPNPGSNTTSRWQKIYQLGTVKIGNYVEIGANSAIDRGALDNTVICDGVIIDNHVHIAHNCHIGANTALAAGVAMAGSTKIGENCTFGGCVGIAGHIEIADNSHFSGMTMVTGNVKTAGQYSSGTAMSPSRQWRRNAVRFNQLDDMAQRLKQLENNQPSTPPGADAE